MPPIDQSRIEENEEEDVDDEGYIEEVSGFIEGDSQIVAEAAEMFKVRHKVRPQSMNLPKSCRIVDHSSALPRLAKADLLGPESRTKNLELNAAKQKINQMRKMHGALIGLGERDTSEVNRAIPSLSV